MNINIFLKCAQVYVERKSFMYIYIYIYVYIYICIYTYIMNSFDAGVGGCFASTIQLRTPRAIMLKRFKMNQQMYPKRPRWNQKETKSKEPRRVQKTLAEQGRRSDGQSGYGRRVRRGPLRLLNLQNTREDPARIWQPALRDGGGGDECA